MSWDLPQRPMGRGWRVCSRMSTASTGGLIWIGISKQIVLKRSSGRWKSVTRGLESRSRLALSPPSLGCEILQTCASLSGHKPDSCNFANTLDTHDISEAPEHHERLQQQ